MTVVGVGGWDSREGPVHIVPSLPLAAAWTALCGADIIQAHHTENARQEATCEGCLGAQPNAVTVTVVR